MRAISCDAQIHGPGFWRPCPNRISGDQSAAGWVTSRQGDFCPRHAAMLRPARKRAS